MESSRRSKRRTVKGLCSSGKRYLRSVLRDEADGSKFMPVCKRYYSKTAALRMDLTHRDSDLCSRNIRLAQSSAYIRIGYVIVNTSEQSGSETDKFLTT